MLQSQSSPSINSEDLDTVKQHQSRNGSAHLDNFNSKLNELRNSLPHIMKYFILALHVKFGTIGQVPMRPIAAIAVTVGACVALPVVFAAAAVCCSFLALFQLLTLEFKKFCKTLACVVGVAVALPLAMAAMAVACVLEIAYTPFNFFLSLASLAIGKIDLMRKQKNLTTPASPDLSGAVQVDDEALNKALTQYSKEKTWCQSRESAAVESEFHRNQFDEPNNELLRNKAERFFKNPKNKGKRLYNLLEPVLSSSLSPA